jgi:nicotinate phosphoribosyltransferase
MEELKSLLAKVLPEREREVWALPEGQAMRHKEVVLRIKAPYQSYALYETAICGLLSHSSGWASAARECVDAAAGIPVVSFGARHVHPAVAGLMDYAAITGGCQGCSSFKGAELAGISPSGTMPHALVLVMGDTVSATLAFDRHIPPEVSRVSLVDTFGNEVEDALDSARALGERLWGVRLDTPRERGGVTVELTREVRDKLNSAGFNHVRIFVSGGFDKAKIQRFVEQKAPVDGFGVGSYITSASPIDFTADLHEIDGRPVAKCGRSPGITANARLERIM